MNAITFEPGTAQEKRYAHNPYGQTLKVGAGSSSANAVQYTGRENDGAQGGNCGGELYYCRARYYEPVLTSRFKLAISNLRTCLRSPIIPVTRGMREKKIRQRYQSREICRARATAVQRASLRKAHDGGSARGVLCGAVCAAHRLSMEIPAQRISEMADGLCLLCQVE